jgi:hypothetical protein
MELALDPQVNAAVPGPAVAPPASQLNDYWDINGVPNGASVDHDAAQQSEFSGLNAEGGAASAGSGRQKLLGLIALLIVVALTGYAAYLQFIEERDLIAEVTALVMGKGGEEAAGDAEPTLAPRVQARQAPVAASGAKASGRKTVAGNPYWHLPNAIIGSQPPQERLWTAEEEETWRAGLAHRYSYQRWKTVQDVRQVRLKGSEAILWDALQDKKFWTRAYAAIGLAEIDVPVSLQTLDATMQNARSELIADFFERFTKRCNPGQCFVLRQAIRLLDAKGRLVALQGIARSKDALRDLYLTAATLDPDKRVKKWVKSYLAWRPIAPDKYNELLDVASGKLSGDYLLGGIKASKRSLTMAGGNSAAKGDDTLDLSTEEELDKEIEQLDKDAGDVEIYEPEAAGPAVKDESDADTFEYVE